MSKIFLVAAIIGLLAFPSIAHAIDDKTLDMVNQYCLEHTSDIYRVRIP